MQKSGSMDAIAETIQGQKVRKQMKIVIDIPKDEYDEICSDKFDTTGYFKLNLSNAFRNCTSLPKGHGRLIDADALKKYIDDCECCVGCENESYGCADKCRCPDYLDEDMERIINNQPTIIEADGGNAE